MPFPRPTPTRRALLALAFGAFGLATGEFVTLGLLPQVAAGVHATIPQAGNVVAAYALGVVVGAPLLTAVSVRAPRKPLLVVLVLALAAGNVGSALAPGFHALLVLRFLAGLPHGAYFGVAAVVASSMVAPGRRARAMAVVFGGLTVANVVGVPLATLVGQHASWRTAFWLVAGAEVLAAVLVVLLVPAPRPEALGPTSLAHELAAFRRPPVWLTLVMAVLGGGALFTTFSYIAPMMTGVAGFAASDVSWLLVLFGVGMTLGNVVGARLADHSIGRAIVIALTCQVVVAAVFFGTARTEWTAAPTVLVFAACAAMLIPAVQARLVHEAGGAPNLAAASMHSAFNVANSLGAWLGGAVIASGLGYAAVNLAASGVAVVGLLLALLTAAVGRRHTARATATAAVETPSPVGR